MYPFYFFFSTELIRLSKTLLLQKTFSVIFNNYNVWQEKIAFKTWLTSEDHLAECNAKIAYCNRALTYVGYFRTITDNDDNLNNKKTMKELIGVKLVVGMSLFEKEYLRHVFMI